jgi:hypothetical protein
MQAEVGSDPNLLEFISVALNQTELSGVCQMLAAAVKVMDAWGTFLWQLHDGRRFSSNFRA